MHVFDAADVIDGIDENADVKGLAVDIADQGALVRGYTTGGQKSVHEVFLTRGERHELLHNMSLLLDEDTDRFFLLRLDRSARSYALGVAAKPVDPDYFYVG